MLALYIAGILFSMIVIWRACDGFEAASAYLGRNLTDGVRGATINAIGSSMPELLTATIALVIYSDKAGFAFGIGVTAGSAIFNSAVIPSLIILVVLLTGIAQKITVSRKVVLRDGLFLLGAEVLLIWLLTASELDWHHGLILILTYGLYIFITLTFRSKAECEDEEEEPNEIRHDSRGLAFLSLDLEYAFLGNNNITTNKAWGLLTLAIGVIAAACHILVESCYGIGEALSINTYFIAVILAAAATSVPDTLLSIKDARNGKYDDAVANALGSNIFDVCVCLGLPLFLYCLATGDTVGMSGEDQGSITELRVFLLGSTFAVFLLFLMGKTMNLLKGVLMAMIYVVFVAFIFGRASDNHIANEIGIWLQQFISFLS
jgi:cation:H+ antiporter